LQHHQALNLTKLQVNAVDYPELHKWYDVIIFPTQGDRSLASLLAGGGESFNELFVVFVH
jgi:hypothetical protein